MSEAAISAKSEIVSQIKDKLSRAKSVVIVDYRGLTVSEVTELRNNMRAAGVEYKVLKNTMMSRACEELGITGVEEHLSDMQNGEVVWDQGIFWTGTPFYEWPAAKWQDGQLVFTDFMGLEGGEDTRMTFRIQTNEMSLYGLR